MQNDKMIDRNSNEVYQKIQGGNACPPDEKKEKGQDSLAGMIDHTLLKADASADQIKQLCGEAARYHFSSVCVNTCYVPFAAKLLQDTGVAVCCVVGFPLGAMSTRAKAEEAQEAAANGAKEVDMVINVGAIKSGNWEYVQTDIAKVVESASAGGAIVKVILETCLLTDEEKVKACQVSKQSGAAFVKTSTGFSTGGATAEDVRLMRDTVGPSMGVKASGGIGNYDDAVKMIRAGASRIGTSHGIEIIRSGASSHSGNPS